MMIIFSCLFLGTLIFTFFNDRFYNMPIGQITQITDIQSQKVTDEHKNKDIKYKEKITFKILNGEFKGQTTTIPHQYVKSQADSESFSKNDKVLLHISKNPKDATIIEKTRYYCCHNNRLIFTYCFSCWKKSRTSIYIISYR